MRFLSPGEYGCTHSAKRRSRFPADKPQQPGDSLIAEVFLAIRVQRGLDVVVVPRRTGAHSWVEPSAGQDVDGGEILRQPQRVFPAERYHRGAELDPRRALGGGGQHGDRRGDAVLQVPVANPGAIEAEPLT
jgi:hypothetical protein